jgi:hypothetical protein
MAIKNKDFFELIERYKQLRSNRVISESSEGTAIANQVSTEVKKLNKISTDDDDDGFEDSPFHKFSTGKAVKGPDFYKGTSLTVWSYKTLLMAMNDHFSTKLPLFILGDPGIGKSDVVKLAAKRMASASTRGKFIEKKEGSIPARKEGEGPKEFVVWSELNDAKKREIMRNPENY